MLTEEERNKIEEEEKLRAELRDKHNKPPKKTSLLTWIVLAMIVAIAVLMAIPTSPSPSSQAEQPKARTLDAEISSDRQGINVYNKEQEAWTNCKIRLNVYWKNQRNFQPGQSVILYDDLLKDGNQRFNWYSTKPTDINIQCENPYGVIQGYF